MYHVKHRKDKRIKRRLKIRNKIVGKPDMPRISVFRSNKYIYAQLIDDTKGKTLVSASSLGKSVSHKGKKVDQAFEVGKSLGENAVKAGIKKAVFDRGGYRYHGRVQKVAEGAREGGLKL